MNAPRQSNATQAVDSLKFADMEGSQKLVFIGKLCVFFITFGFAFGTLLD